MNAKRSEGGEGRGGFFSALRPVHLRPGPAAAVSACFVVAVIAATGGTSVSRSSVDLREFEVGRVAERDVVAERSVSYVDEEATRLRREAQEKLVPAVFRFSEASSREALENYARFADLVRKLFEERVSAEAFHLAIQAEYPLAFNKGTIDSLYRNPGRTKLLESCSSILRIVMDGGILSLPEKGVEGFNPDAAELVRKQGGRTERERVSLDSVVTLASAPSRIAEVAASGSYPAAAVALAPALLAPFVAENAFFSAEESALKLQEARARVAPVLKKVERGDRVIREGFIVSKEDMDRLQALGSSQSKVKPGLLFGRIILLALAFALLIFLAGQRVTGRLLAPKEVYLLAAMGAVYLIGASFAGHAKPPVESFPLAIFLPTALITMLPAVLMGVRVASAIAVALPIAAFVSGSFDQASFAFALASGVVGAFALQGAEHRMDLVKAGAVIALAQIVAATGVLLADRAAAVAYPATLFWAAFNGFACGMAVLGFLPLLEQALNAATTFRLIELSDLNAPVLKRLLTVAPGTYSHSVTVANLAESACREIGANAILARVGGYYHDIGKMDQPDYFIENQSAYNKHDELAPRLSATVIRSHVKVGIEKARRLGMPKEVIDIIAEHHGNSVISWFYNEALKREDQVNADDFAYPGTPPRTRESAVVMLADTVEAAVRTLKKPTMSRLDKFVQELIMSKFEQGQLSESELTFRDLETIKNAFVRILAGHYHSRIEYPKSVREILR